MNRDPRYNDFVGNWRRWGFGVWVSVFVREVVGREVVCGGGL